MNTYAIEFWGYTSNVVGETAGKAKYNFFREHEIGDSIDFEGFIRQVKCKLVHKFHYKDLFTHDMVDFQDTLIRRDIKFAYLGMKVEVDGKPGRIVGCNNSLNLDICFDGEFWRSNCHPWWRIKYYDNNGNVAAEYNDR
jgi:hypothetical protein